MPEAQEPSTPAQTAVSSVLPIGSGYNTEAEDDGRAWANLDAMLWFFHGGNSPPLVTTSPTGTPITAPGVLGPTGTTVVIGGREVGDFDPVLGGSVLAGYWIDREHTLGVEASGFWTATQAIHLSASSDSTGNPILARPIIDANLGTESSVTVAFPGAFSGNVSVDSTMQMWEANADVIERLSCCSGQGVDVLLGVRLQGLDERLDIVQNTTVLANGGTFFQGAPVAAPNGVRIEDTFTVRNEFVGGEAGLRTRMDFGALTLDVTGKVGIGYNQETLSVSGSSQLVTPSGVTQTASGGLLALSSNSGQLVHHEFAAIPELNFKFEYQLTSYLTASLGYDVLFWSAVERSGDSIDRTVNTTLQPTGLQGVGTPTGIQQPFAVFSQHGIWAQGVTAGLGFHY